MVDGLLDKHKGEEAWLFTKGPSFDDFDMNTAGKLRIGVNNACEFVSDVVYCVNLWADHHKLNVPKGCVLLNGKDETGKSVVSRAQRSVDTFTPQSLPLFFQYSVMSLAMSYVAWMGIKTLHLIGCDPAQGYSKCFEWKRGPLTADEVVIQHQTKNLIVEMADKAGITIYDYGRAA
jgi:hypothetical protein